MNTQEEHPQDDLEIAASQAIGLIYLLSYAATHEADDPHAGPTPNEKEGVEMLTVTITSDLRKAVDRINNRTEGQTPAMSLTGNGHASRLENQTKGDDA